MGGGLPLDIIKAPLRAIRDLPDRVLHTTRRRRALRQLSGTVVRSAVFICHGNINRSAYAGAVFARAVPPDRTGDVTVRSAGFIGPNRPASQLAQTLATERGADLSGHRSRLIDATELREADLVVVMSAAQRRDASRLTGRPARDIVILGDLDPAPIERRTIQDPYGHTVDVFEHVFDRIDRCVHQLSAAIWTR